MNGEEIITLVRLAETCAPQQKFDPFTPDAWMELIGDLRFEDCKQAMFNVARRQPFVAPAEIRAEVAVIRCQRIQNAPPIEPPPGLGELEYRRWLRRTRTAIADGETVEPRVAIGKSMPVIEGTFQRVPGRS